MFVPGMNLIGSVQRTPAKLAGVAFLGIAALAGLLAGVDPAIGLALAIGLVFVLIVMWDLVLGVCGFIFIAPLDVLSKSSDLSITKVAGAMLVVAWLAAVATQGASKRELIAGQPWLAAVLIAFLSWSLLSAVWAESPAAAYRSTMRFALNATLFPIVYFAVRERRHVLWVFAIFVLGADLSVLWGIAHPPPPDMTVAGQDAASGRLTGARADSNVLATLMLVATLFAGALAFALRRVPLAAPISLAAAIGGLVALFATFSRGGLVALAVAILVGIVYGGRWRKALAALSVVAVVVGAFYIGGAGDGNGATRLLNNNTSGRSSIWEIGWRMVKANPVIGVGAGNYQVAEPHYLLTQPGAIQADHFIVDTPYVAHNIYLHILAEVGVIGLTLFLGLVALSLLAAVRAVRIFKLRGDQGLEVVGRVLVIGIAGILAADFFVSEQYSKQLWVLLAMGPALLAVAQREADPRTLVPLRPRAASRR